MIRLMDVKFCQDHFTEDTVAGRTRSNDDKNMSGR